MNKVIMKVTMAADPEIRYTQGDQPIALASMRGAVNRRFRREGQPDADFFNFTAFGKQAEFVEKWLKKGSKVLVTGTLQNDDYTDKNGVKHYACKIIVEEIEFAESKKASGDGAAVESAPADSAAEVAAIPAGIDEELPFT